jgi:hypothetical protein
MTERFTARTGAIARPVGAEGAGVTPRSVASIVRVTTPEEEAGCT